MEERRIADAPVAVERRSGRPRKTDDERLVPVTVAYPRDFLDDCKRVADSKQVSVRHVIRVITLRQFRNLKTQNS